MGARQASQLGDGLIECLTRLVRALGALQHAGQVDADLRHRQTVVGPLRILEGFAVGLDGAIDTVGGRQATALVVAGPRRDVPATDGARLGDGGAQQVAGLVAAAREQVAAAEPGSGNGDQLRIGERLGARVGVLERSHRLGVAAERQIGIAPAEQGSNLPLGVAARGEGAGGLAPCHERVLEMPSGGGLGGLLGTHLGRFGRGADAGGQGQGERHQGSEHPVQAAPIAACMRTVMMIHGSIPVPLSKGSRYGVAQRPRGARSDHH